MAQYSEPGDERIQIALEMNRAIKEHDSERYAQLLARRRELDAIRWQSLITRFPELSPFPSIVEAFQQTALQIGVPFPDLMNPALQADNTGSIFGMADRTYTRKRTIQVWLRWNEKEECGYYDVDIFEYRPELNEKHRYTGKTPALEKATHLISLWFVERCSIEDLHAQLPWMSAEPARTKDRPGTEEDSKPLDTAFRAKINTMIWQSIIVRFPELAPFPSLMEACRHTATHIGVPFPDLSLPTIQDRSVTSRFDVTDGTRTIYIEMKENHAGERGYYHIDIFEYQPEFEAERRSMGQTPSLDEATRLVSLWFVERCSIEDLHAQLPWMSAEPAHLKGRRMPSE